MVLYFLYEYTIVPSPFDEGRNVENKCQIKSGMTGETSMYVLSKVVNTILPTLQWFVLITAPEVFKRRN